MRKYLFLLGVLSCGLSAGLVRADGAAAVNLLPNPGFETWVAATQQANWPAVPDGMLQDYNPTVSAYEQDHDKNFAVQGTIAKDTTIKHGGEAALRLENGLPTDITDVNSKLFAVEPSTIYKLTVWMRGEKIVANPQDGAGAFLWYHTVPTNDRWKDISWGADETVTPRTGTFDWTQVSWRIETNDKAHFMDIVLQLRRASGKVWYDDAELVAVGKVTPVQTQ